MTSTYLSFTVCDELFAVNVINVLEVLQKQHITHVPNAPYHIKGIINFRGDVVPVFESRTKFNLTPRPVEASYVIIVLDLSSDSDVFRIGAIVDRVRDVIVIDEAAIQPVPAMGADFSSELFHGIFKLKENFILLLNAEKVFSDEALFEIKSIKQNENIAV
jgi:purine-binding chemotaxis protein CheW